MSLSKERVGLIGDGLGSTTWISLFNGRVGSIDEGNISTSLTSIFKGRVGSTNYGIRSMTLTTNGGSRESLRQKIGSCGWEIVISSNNF
jgi:hypothetical protein